LTSFKVRCSVKPHFSKGQLLKLQKYCFSFDHDIVMAAYDGTICSCIGVVFLLVALTGAQSGRLKGDDLTSLLLNTIGGVMATVGAVLDRVWAFAVLNGVWALLSAFNTMRIHLLKKKEALSGDTTHVTADSADNKQMPNREC
jgi:hypothetical protein